MLWLINGDIFTMKQKGIINKGYLGIDKDKIVYVGEKTKIATNDKVIDVSGSIVMPGIIEAHCHIGISEEKKGAEGDDCNEATEPSTPYLRAIDGINPLDPAFHEAIKAGITSVMVGPGSANVIGGQFAFIKTHGRSIDEMIVKAPAAMKVAFGENPKAEYGARELMPSTRMGIASLLREELFTAKQYYSDKKHGDTNFKENYRLEPWIPVIEKKIPLKAHVHRTDDILTAMRIAKEFDVKVTLDHCTEGHLIIDEIKQSGFPAICGPHFANRDKLEIQNADFKTPGILSENGILVSLTTDHPVTLIQFLPLCAAMAVKKGMKESEALRSLTVNAAKICEVEDQVGSIEEGLDADIAVFSGSPLKIETETLYTIINGQIIYDKNHIEDLENKFQG